MRVPRILNQGRIAPLSPKPMLESARTSWGSTASAVSSRYTQSPNPNLTEQVTQKLQESTVKPSLSRKIYITLGITGVLLLVLGVFFGALLPNVLNKHLDTTSTTSAFTSISTTSNK